MSDKELVFDDIEAINKEIQMSIQLSDKIKTELLRFYLVNYVLYLNLKIKPNHDDEFCEVKDELLKISILLEKLYNMEKKLTNFDSKRLATSEMVKNKSKVSSKAFKAPGKRYKENFEKQQDRVSKKSDIRRNVNKFN